MAYPERVSKEVRQVVLPNGSPISTVVVQLRKIREMKKMTQQDIADLLNVTKNTIENIESGRRSPSIQLMEMYAKILGGQISFCSWT